MVDQAVERAAKKKVDKHEKACVENNHAFLPFAFDSFGALEREAGEFLRRIQKVMGHYVTSPGSVHFVFSRPNFAIQRAVAAQLVARLPGCYL